MGLKMSGDLAILTKHSLTAANFDWLALCEILLAFPKLGGLVLTVMLVMSTVININSLEVHFVCMCILVWETFPLGNNGWWFPGINRCFLKKLFLFTGLSLCNRLFYTLLFLLPSCLNFAVGVQSSASFSLILNLRFSKLSGTKTVIVLTTG